MARPRDLNVLPSAKIGAMENSKTPVSLHDFKSKMKYATVKLLR
jgi:hypothetical protein